MYIPARHSDEASLPGGEEMKWVEEWWGSRSRRVEHSPCDLCSTSVEIVRRGSRKKNQSRRTTAHQQHKRCEEAIQNETGFFAMWKVLTPTYPLGAEVTARSRNRFRSGIIPGILEGPNVPLITGPIFNSEHNWSWNSAVICGMIEESGPTIKFS